MENTENKKNRFAGMTADEVFAQAMNANTAEITEATESTIQKPAAPRAPQPLVVQAPTSEAVQEMAAKLRETKQKHVDEEANRTAAETVKKLEVPPTIPIQSIVAKDEKRLVKINELFTRHIAETTTFHINGHTITITLNGDYDALVRAVGMAANLIVDSGDNYVFSPNQTIIGALVFLREVTDVNLEFLIRPEIRISQLIETYDILMPLIQHIETINNEKFQAYRGWYIRELAASVEAAISYQNSAKGIVDALAAHNIKDQQTMTEQIAELDSDKLSTVIDFMAKVESKKQ